MNTDKIHGVPTPPLGYRLLLKGEPWECGDLRRYEPHHGWSFAVQDIEPSHEYHYAVPLNDGYDYFGEGETVIQAGDEVEISDRWVPYGAHNHGQNNRFPLRRLRYKPSPLALGRNFNGLTEEQVGVSEGWRLITWEEERTPPKDAQRWDDESWQPRLDNPGSFAPSNVDYRTKAPLPQKEITPQSLQDDVESLPIPFDGQNSEEQLKAILARIAETLDYHSKVIAGIQNTEIKKWGRNPGDGQP